MHMWAKRLTEVMAERGYTMVDLSARSGVPYDSVKKYCDGKVAQPRGEIPARLAEALGVNRVWLMEGVGPKTDEDVPNLSQNQKVDSLVTEADHKLHGGSPATLPCDVPVWGTTAGADAGAIQVNTTGEPVDHVRRPPGIAGAKDVYALYVQGDSMEPRFEHGELIYVHPHRPVRPGDYVVVQIKPNEHDVAQSYVKRLVRRTTDRLECAQLNPAATVRFKADTVAFVHKILTMNELFGV